MKIRKAMRITAELFHYTRQLPPQTRLPSEEELAIRYKVSRATIRQALEALWLRGEVVRVWGEGTFTASQKPVPAAIYVDSDEVGSLFLRLQERGVDVERTHFSICTQENTVEIKRSFKISGKPAIFLCDNLPRFIRNMEVDWTKLADPAVSLVEIFSQNGERVVKEESNLLIAPIPLEVATLSGFSAGEPSIYVEQQTVCASAKVLANTTAYIDLKTFPHRLVRVIGKGRF